MRFIPGKTHALVGVKGSPFAVNFHLQFTAYYHHVFNHPRLVRRGFTQGAGRQGDGEMIELQRLIPREQRFHHHRLLLRVEHRLPVCLRRDKRRERDV